MTNEEFFGLADRTIWRLETLPVYSTPTTDPAFAAYIRRGELPPLAERPAKRAWMTLVRQAVAKGKRVGRVHVLRLPLTAYLQYELATYAENAAAGEDVRIAVVDDHPELATLDQDYWLLDDGLALIMDYDDAGRFRGERLTRDRATLARCRAHRDLAIACSVPLAAFAAEVRTVA